MPGRPASGVLPTGDGRTRSPIIVGALIEEDGLHRLLLRRVQAAGWVPRQGDAHAQELPRPLRLRTLVHFLPRRVGVAVDPHLPGGVYMRVHRWRLWVTVAAGGQILLLLR